MLYFGYVILFFTLVFVMVQAVDCYRGSLVLNMYSWLSAADTAGAFSCLLRQFFCTFMLMAGLSSALVWLDHLNEPIQCHNRGSFTPGRSLPFSRGSVLELNEGFHGQVGLAQSLRGQVRNFSVLDDLPAPLNKTVQCAPLGVFGVPTILHNRMEPLLFRIFTPDLTWTVHNNQGPGSVMGVINRKDSVDFVTDSHVTHFTLMALCECLNLRHTTNSTYEGTERGVIFLRTMDEYAPLLEYMGVARSVANRTQYYDPIPALNWLISKLHHNYKSAKMQKVVTHTACLLSSLMYLYVEHGLYVGVLSKTVQQSYNKMYSGLMKMLHGDNAVSDLMYSVYKAVGDAYINPVMYSTSEVRQAYLILNQMLAAATAQRLPDNAIFTLEQAMLVKQLSDFVRNGTVSPYNPDHLPRKSAASRAIRRDKSKTSK